MLIAISRSLSCILFALPTEFPSRSFHASRFLPQPYLSPHHPISPISLLISQVDHPPPSTQANPPPTPTKWTSPRKKTLTLSLYRGAPQTKSPAPTQPPADLPASSTPTTQRARSQHRSATRAPRKHTTKTADEALAARHHRPT